MKTLLKSLASTLLLTATIGGLCLTSVALSADGNKPATAKDKMVDHIMMKDGKVVAMKGDETKPLKEEMTLTDGTKVMPDGTIVMKDGTKAMLANDDLITMDGKLQKGGAKDHPQSKEKDQTKEGAKKSGQDKGA